LASNLDCQNYGKEDWILINDEETPNAIENSGRYVVG
jgi:hypothetical protein